MRLVEICEFEKINQFTQCKDKKKFGVESFKELDRFINEFQETNNDVDPTFFFKKGYNRTDGDYIQARNYVGLIQLVSGCQIQILPKIDLSSKLKESGKDKRSREIKIFLDMLRCLKELSFKTHSSASLFVANNNLYEIFIRMYVDEAHELVRHYLKSNYTNVEDNLNVYKGKLIVNDHIKRNLVHKERFYVSYDDYNLNRPENKLIKSTLLKLQRISTDYSNTKSIQQLLMSFETIDESNNYDKDFACVSHDRSMAFYENLMLWSKVFLKGQSFTSFAGSTTALSLLFPMEKVFEAYVTKLVKRCCSSVRPDWDVSTQDRGEHLYNDPPSFPLRPDIVIRNNKENKKTIAILDTKWKRLVNDKSKNYGISQADMYQMYAYSKKYDCQNIWLLYPMTNEVKDEICYREEKTEKNAIVHVFFIDLEHADDSINKLMDKIN